MMTNTSVSSLLMNGTECVGIEVTGRSGKTERIKAREVILSAGAIHSPAILLRAGIGPAPQLKDIGVEIVAHRQGVGRSLSDHPAVAISSYLRPEARLNGLTGRHMLIGLRYSSRVEDALDNDMLVIGVSKSAWHAVGDQIASMLVCVYQTMSQTGTVDLASRDWRAEPVVRFNLLSDRRDLTRIIDGVRRVAGFYDSTDIQSICPSPFPASYNENVRKVGRINRWNSMKTWAAATLADASPMLRRALYGKFIHGRYSLGGILASDDEMEDFIRREAIGLWHASCSCRMGAANDPDAVTDPEGRVYGINGLRVVDASIFPAVPRANTNIPTMMVAEKIASAMKSKV
jgi:5-(hydroxymethyl)furfural/furfural oxidase